jgi:hypothetical protein
MFLVNAQEFVYPADFFALSFAALLFVTFFISPTRHPPVLQIGHLWGSFGPGVTAPMPPRTTSLPVILSEFQVRQFLGRFGRSPATLGI